MGNRSHTLVIGGGIVGLSSAYFLARRGERVTVLERDPIGEGASSGNAGIIAVAHPPLPRPGVLRKTFRLMLDPEGPVYVRPRLDRSLPAWLWGFRRACVRERFAGSMEILCRIGREAGDCFRQVVEEESIDCRYSPLGWMEVFATEKGFAEGRTTAALTRRHGYEAVEYGGAELRRRDPAFRRSVVGAVHYTDSAFADPESTIRGLAAAAERHGAAVLPETPASAIRIEGGRFSGVETGGGEYLEGDRLVLAAGAWSTALAGRTGIRIPMQAAKGYHLDLANLGARPSTTCVLAERFVAVTPLGDSLRLAGTVELSGLNLDISQRRVDRLLSGARSFLEGLEQARVTDTWCGLRPMTADGLPVIGPAPGVEGLFVATGHAMMGFLLGPLTGRLVAESILDGGPSLEIGELDAGRF